MRGYLNKGSVRFGVLFLFVAFVHPFGLFAKGCVADIQSLVEGAGRFELMRHPQFESLYILGEDNEPFVLQDLEARSAEWYSLEYLQSQNQSLGLISSLGPVEGVPGFDGVLFGETGEVLLNVSIKSVQRLRGLRSAVKKALQSARKAYRGKSLTQIRDHNLKEAYDELFEINRRDKMSSRGMRLLVTVDDSDQDALNRMVSDFEMEFTHKHNWFLESIHIISPHQFIRIERDDILASML